MAENYEPLAPAGGAPLPPPPVAASPAAPVPAQGKPAPSPAATPAPAAAGGGGGGASPYPPLLPPTKQPPPKHLPLARKNQKPISPNKQKSTSVTFGPATIIGGDDKISENVSTINDDGNADGEGKNDLVSGVTTYADTVTTGKTRRNNARFYCMITSGIMGGIFALASIIIGIFTFVRE